MHGFIVLMNGWGGRLELVQWVWVGGWKTCKWHCV